MTKNVVDIDVKSPDTVLQVPDLLRQILLVNQQILEELQTHTINLGYLTQALTPFGGTNSGGAN